MTEKSLEKEQQKQLDHALLAELGVDKAELKKLKKKLQKAEGRPERGIETWFRLTSKNLYTRLKIVDAKANILITSNSIIISVILGSLYPRLSEDPHLIFAVGGMILTNVLSITYAILAAIPNKVTSTKESKEPDLMTFEDFHQMPLGEYYNKVVAATEEGEALYSSIINDVHNLGVKLARKYRLIRTSFLIFMIGMVFSVFAFATCHAFF